MTPAPLGNRLLIVLALSGFVTSFGAHVVAVNLPSYAQAIGVGAFMIGLLIAVYDFAELFAKPLAGYIADRRGLKLMLFIGLAVFISGSLLYLVIPPQYLLAVRFAQGLGAAALSTVSITLVAKYFEERRGRAFGIYNAIKGAGYVIAPAVGGFLVAGFGFGSLFIACAALGAVALGLSLLVPADAPRAGALADDDDEPSLKDFFRIFAERRLLAAYGTIVVNMLLVGILFGFLPVYLHSIDYSPIQSGITLTIATLSYLAVQPFAGHLADKIPIRPTIVGGLALAAVSIGAASFLTGIPLLLAVIAAGVGVGTVWTNTDALIGALSDKSRLGASMGAAQSFKEMGDMLGPLLIGAITQFFGIRVGFVSCAALALLCLVPLIKSRGLDVRRHES